MNGTKYLAVATGLLLLSIQLQALGADVDCSKTPDSLGCWASRQKNVRDMASGLDLTCIVKDDANGGGANCWHKGWGKISSGRFVDPWTFSISGLKNPKRVEVASGEIYILDDDGLKFVDVYKSVFKLAKLPGDVVAPAVRLTQFTAPTSVSSQSRGVCAIDTGLLKCLFLDDNPQDYKNGGPPVSAWTQMRTFTKLKRPRSLVSANLSTFVIVDDGRVIEIETGHKLKVHEYKLPHGAKAKELFGGGANFCVRMDVKGTERILCDGDDRWRQITDLPKGYETQKTLGIGLSFDIIALETEAGVSFSGYSSYSEQVAPPKLDYRNIRKMDGYGHYCLLHGRATPQLTCWNGSTDRN